MSRIPGNPSNRFWLYLLPGFLMLLWIIIVPAVWNIYLSFTNYRGIKPPQFAGLTNWVRLMKDTTFWVSFCNSIWPWWSFLSCSVLSSHRWYST